MPYCVVFLSRNIDMLKCAFIVYTYTFVHFLEYNSVVWSPQYKEDIKAIERVQRRFSKRLPGLKEFSYKECLKFLGWPTLELRRLHTDLMWSYKILFGLVHLNSDHIFKLSPNQTRGHGFKLYKQFSSSTVHSSVFAHRVVTFGTVYRLLLILLHLVHLSDRFNV